MDAISAYPLLKSFLAGSFSGTFSTILFQPLDLVKTRLQNPVALNSGHHGMVSIFGQVLRNEQLWGLWRGMTPSITRCVPGVGLYFSSLDWLKSSFTDGQPNPLEAVALGMVARSLTAGILIPITVVKTRYESGVYQYKSMPNALQCIYRHEGLRGLICGLGPTILRDAPFSGLYLMFYTQTKQLMISSNELVIQKNSKISNPLTHFSCGILAGVMASLVTQPADVIKTQMQLYPDKYRNVWLCILDVHKQAGVQGYFKGVVPRMLRRTLMAAMAWTVYEQVTTWVGVK